jgi:hypothetical protein
MKERVRRYRAKVFVALGERFPDVGGRNFPDLRFAGAPKSGRRPTQLDAGTGARSCVIRMGYGICHDGTSEFESGVPPAALGCQHSAVHPA